MITFIHNRLLNDCSVDVWRCQAQRFMFSWFNLLSQYLCLLPLEVSDQIWLLLLKDSEEDVFGCLTSSFQGAAEEFPHPLLSGRDSPDGIIVFLLDYTFPEEIIQDWSCIGHSCDQITLVFIHKVLHWGRRGGETLWLGWCQASQTPVRAAAGCFHWSQQTPTGWVVSCLWTDISLKTCFLLIIMSAGFYVLSTALLPSDKRDCETSPP